MWSKVINIFKSKAHLTKEGLIQLVNIKAAFPNGLTKSLKDSFPKCESYNTS